MGPITLSPFWGTRQSGLSAFHKGTTAAARRLNKGPHGWESIVLSTEQQQLALHKISSNNPNLKPNQNPKPNLRVWAFSALLSFISINRWAPEGCYQYSKMFCWEPEGRNWYTMSMAIAPFWFSTIHLWLVIAPFWLSTDNLIIAELLKRLTSMVFCWSMPRLCMRRRACSLNSPMGFGISVTGLTCCVAGTPQSANHLCALIWPMVSLLAGLMTSMCLMRFSHSARKGNKETLWHVRLELSVSLAVQIWNILTALHLTRWRLVPSILGAGVYGKWMLWHNQIFFRGWK